MKKGIYICILFWIIIISGCVTRPSQTIINTYEVTREITKIILITPIPTPSSIKETTCYDTANTQYDLNQCAGNLADKAKNEMDDLVKLIVNKFSYNPEKANEIVNLQNEWETSAYEECRIWYGKLLKYPETGNLYYENGSMAPMLWSNCLETKYKNRIEELQWLLEL